MSRANSLKKAVRQIIEHAEKAVDEQNQQTEERRKKHKLINRRFYKKSLGSSGRKTSAMTPTPKLSLPSKQKSGGALSISPGSSTTEPESSSATPSPALRSTETKFSYIKSPVNKNKLKFT